MPNLVIASAKLLAQKFKWLLATNPSSITRSFVTETSLSRYRCVRKKGAQLALLFAAFPLTGLAADPPATMYSTGVMSYDQNSFVWTGSSGWFSSTGGACYTFAEQRRVWTQTSHMCTVGIYGVDPGAADGSTSCRISYEFTGGAESGASEELVNLCATTVKGNGPNNSSQSAASLWEPFPYAKWTCASISYTYDAAHRLTGATDARGNSVTYTLDNVGNRITEQLKDPGGVLQRSMSRRFDALNRVQQLQVQ